MKHEIIDLALYFPTHKTAVISDLHIGIEEAMNKQGMMVPRFHGKDIIKRLNRIFSRCNPDKIVINGDFKHEFGEISDQEWRDSMRVLDHLMEKGEVILVRGNHDTIIEPIIRKRKLSFTDHYLFGDCYICHGDKRQDNQEFESAKLIVVGHVHPSLRLSRGGRTESYKCFLFGRFKEKDMIVMPSMSDSSVGTDISQLTSIMGEEVDFSEFRVIASLDKAYDFGVYKEIEGT
jgi:hypothetical protein